MARKIVVSDNFLVQFDTSAKRLKLYFIATQAPKGRKSTILVVETKNNGALTSLYKKPVQGSQGENQQLEVLYDIANEIRAKHRQQQDLGAKWLSTRSCISPLTTQVNEGNQEVEVPFYSSLVIAI